MEYRPLPDAHRDAFARIVRYAFAPERGPDVDDDEERQRPDIYEPRGLYDAASNVATADLDPAALRAVCAYYDFTARVRGEWHRVGGVSAVASPPETRRRGHVARLIGELLRELREEGVYFSTLWPFEYEFYRRLGWGIVGTRDVTEVSPADLGDAAAAPDGRFRRLGPDDYAALDEAHRAAAAHGLAVRRTEGWWRHRIFRSWRTDPYVYGWEDEGGDLRGYLVYRVEDDDADGETMAVDEAVAADFEARRHLWRFCHDHDSQVARVRIEGDDDGTLFETLADPRAATVERKPGGMVRVVDVAGAVEALSYPPDAAGRTVVEVADAQCPWNDGRFELDVGGGGATCAETTADPDVSADAATLSRLVVGSASVERLERNGDLTVRDRGGAETLAAAFPATDVRVREQF